MLVVSSLTAFYGQESAIAPLTEEVSHGVCAPLPHGVGRQMPGMKHLQMVASGGLLSWLETCPLSGHISSDLILWTQPWGFWV